MKEIDGWVKIKKYTDDETLDKMITAACDAVHGGLYRVDAMKAIEAALAVWHGESKIDIAAIMEEVANNKETVIAAGPEPQFDADEPRYSVHITGPKRLLEKFANLIWGLLEQEK